MFRPLRIFFAMALVAVFLSAGCNKHTATVSPKLSINKRSAEMGTPIEVTYSFSTKQGYVALQKDLTVFVHFLDPRKIRRFQDDHRPPKLTREWRANGNYNYTRTVFIPRNIPAGEYTIALGLYTVATGERIELDGKPSGHRAYEMGKMLIEIPPQEPIIQYSQGWYDPESEPNDIGNYWRWTKKEAILKVRNPNADALLYLKFDGVPERFSSEPQKVTVSIAGHPIDTIPVTSNQPIMKKYNVEKGILSTGKMLEVKLEVDRTFVPADNKVSKDTRQLGVRVYHLYLGKASD